MHHPSRTARGFTLVEILVTVAIIGLLSTLAVVALGDARTRSRDSKRVSDVRGIMTALELYNNDNNGYPTELTPVALGVGSHRALCGGGFKAVCDPGEDVMMGIIPDAPTPWDGDCTESENEYSYETPGGGEYVIGFCLGKSVGELSEGTHTGSPNGIE